MKNKGASMATSQKRLKELEERVMRLEKKLGMAPLTGVVADFKGLMKWLDRRTLGFIWQGEDDRTIALSLMGLERKILETAKAAFSKTKWKIICSEMEGLLKEGVEQDSIKWAQESIQRKVQKLEEMGEIVVGRDPEVEGKWVDAKFLLAKAKENKKLDLKAWKKTLDELAV